jgi:hypothetical protein
VVDGVFIDFELMQRRFFNKFWYFQLNHLSASDSLRLEWWTNFNAVAAHKKMDLLSAICRDFLSVDSDGKASHHNVAMALDVSEKGIRIEAFQPISWQDIILMFCQRAGSEPVA